MALKKKAQYAVFLIMLGIIIFIMGLGFSKPLVDSITTARNATNLNCSSPSINAVTKATCVTLNMGLFYFLGVMIAGSIAVLTGKKTFMAILTAIFVFAVIASMILPLKSLIILWRDANHLNCAATTLVGAKMACIVVDVWLFLFVVAAIAAGATLLFMKEVYPKKE